MSSSCRLPTADDLAAVNYEATSLLLHHTGWRCSRHRTLADSVDKSIITLVDVLALASSFPVLGATAAASSLGTSRLSPGTLGTSVTGNQRSA